jgi:heterodisulfide reductase subunit C
MAKLDLKFKEQLNEVEDAHLLTQCFQCGLCVGDCPAAQYTPGFNPREIVIRAALGLVEDLLDKDSPLWDCTTCYKCYERCPQEVRPIEVITALKNLITEKGLLPENITEAVDNIKKTGRIALVSSAVNRRRKELGLEELPSIPLEELKQLW